jgi:type IV pilus assembly protein PilO
MAKFNEMSVVQRLGILVLVAAIGWVGFYYLYLKDEIQKNDDLKAKIAAKNAENEQLRQFQPLLEQIKRQMAIQEQQIARQKKVVPDDKDADQFIRLLHDTAATAGIEIRRYTAMPTANREFYSEVPFTIDIDGPYYSVLNFFQRVADQERIVNIDNLQMSNPKNSGASKVKTTYTYAPGETVVASCTATTFFSRDSSPTPAVAPGAPGATGAANTGRPAATAAPGAPGAPVAPAPATAPGK